MSVLDATLARTGKLEMLKISHETTAKDTFDGSITVLFNPNQLRYESRAEWSSDPTAGQSIAGGYVPMEFRSTPPATLGIELFFDTYEGDRGEEGGLLDGLRAALVPDNPFEAGAPNGTNVTVHTAKVENLARVQPELHRPPICILQWGKSELFRGVLTQLRQDLTFFLPDGTPVRATLSCTFTAHLTFVKAAEKVQVHSADVAKRRVVRRGDSLSSIAAEKYNDPRRWREIAAENNIDNPRALVPGQVLVIPKLER